MKNKGSHDIDKRAVYESRGQPGTTTERTTRRSCINSWLPYASSVTLNNPGQSAGRNDHRVLLRGGFKLSCPTGWMINNLTTYRSRARSVNEESSSCRTGGNTETGERLHDASSSNP